MDSDDTTSDSTPLTIPASKDELEDEFRKILLSVKFAAESDIVTSTTATATDPEYIEPEPKSDQIEVSAVHDLRRIADLMIAAGYSRERVVDVYARARQPLLDEICKHLDRHSVDGHDEMKIRWIRAANIAVRVVFPCERILFGLIFPDLITDKVTDARFVEIVEDSALCLLRFVETIISRKTIEEMFTALELYVTLSDLLPQIRKIFGSKSGEGIIINEAEKILSSLSESVREILSELEKTLIEFQYKHKTPTRGGLIHPIARYVMNYIKLIAEYKPTLTKIFGSASKLKLRLLQIIMNVKSSLEHIFKYFNDASMGHLFMMNNLHYIVNKIKRSDELTSILTGDDNDDLAKQLTDEYNQAADKYRKSAWEGVLDSLRTEGGIFVNIVPKTVFRHRLKVFNDKFKKARETQSSWVVRDDQLRKDLRASIVDMIVPVYTSFLERHRGDIERDDHPGICITHAVENLKKAVDEIFVEETLIWPTPLQLND